MTEFYFFRDVGGKVTRELVRPERWQWQAIYDDDTFLLQFEVRPDGSGLFHQIREIDESKLHVFRMHNVETGKNIDVVIGKGCRFTHKYRNIVLNANTPQEVRHRWYEFGYKKKYLGGERILSIVIMHDDNIVVTERPDLVRVA